MNDYTTIGCCSLCDGPVQVPMLWASGYPPTPECANCGAVATPNPIPHALPVIQMVARRLEVGRWGDSTDTMRGWNIPFQYPITDGTAWDLAWKPDDSTSAGV